ncbi:hypothetical protein GCM10022253_30250 [Sphingomonas endophytica]|uniref:Uncharacterized protein n=1 Tax=Sphingomonas endophytica TaxID=869719 RepID=A0ABR6N8R4_9SPHN|nr:hypothetical protein [Sphingomonas endophytica]
MTQFEPGKLFWGVVSAAVTLAFFSSQQLPYADASDLVGIGVLYAGSIIAVWIASVSEGFAEKIFVAAAVVLFGWAGVLLGLQVSFAENASRTNDRRCLTIQSDMLSAHPRLLDGHDKFQALGCRPQGVDDRIIVPPTDRERLAGKALPWGGYPPPVKSTQ